MKVIYNTCYADPWIEVASALNDHFNITPIYWIGYHDDNSEHLIRESFPDVIYHPYWDAWKGIFPDEISTHVDSEYLDIDLILNSGIQELQAIKMMDRMDFTGHDFGFAERQRHFRRLLKSWISCFKYLSPDAVISPLIPHRVYDYVIYVICRHYGIPHLSYLGTPFTGHILPVANIETIGNVFDNHYQRLLESETSVLDLRATLYRELAEPYSRIRENDYQTAEPIYMKKQVFRHSRSNGLIRLARKMFSDAKNSDSPIFGPRGLLKKGMETYHKRKNSSIEKSHHSILEYSIKKLQSIRYKNKLKSYYESLTSPADFDRPYVVFMLHYQPELTTNPKGGIFADQALCVEVLCKYIPEDYFIYVKEHRTQFYAHTEGHTSRRKEFYDDLARHPQVCLLPLQTDSFTLIKNSKGVATVTGTSGWEAMTLGKPVITFGLTWYENYSGVLKVSNEESASRIEPFLRDFTFNERDLLAYLNAVQNNTIVAYHYRGINDKLNQPEQECVTVLSNNIQTFLRSWH